MACICDMDFQSYLVDSCIQSAILLSCTQRPLRTHHCMDSSIHHFDIMVDHSDIHGLHCIQSGILLRDFQYSPYYESKWFS